MVFSWVEFLLVLYFGGLFGGEKNSTQPLLFIYLFICFKPLIIIKS